MEEEFLKFGDQICLYSDKAKGYITTMGFNSPELKLYECSKLHRSHIINVRNMIFQMIPKLSYDPHGELKRELKASRAREV